jgi:uncharacterized protein YkuJ
MFFYFLHKFIELVLGIIKVYLEILHKMNNHLNFHEFDLRGCLVCDVEYINERTNKKFHIREICIQEKGPIDCRRDHL